MASFVTMVTLIVVHTVHSVHAVGVEQNKVLAEPVQPMQTANRIGVKNLQEV